MKNTSATDELVLSLTQSVLVGTYSSPAELVLGTNVGTNPAEDYYYYKWVAEEDGTLVITITTEDAENGWNLEGHVLDTETWVPAGFDALTSDADPVVNTIELQVLAGNEVSLKTSGLFAQHAK